MDDHEWLGAEVTQEVIDAIRTDQTERIAAGLWQHIEPVVSWIAGVNTAKWDREAQWARAGHHPGPTTDGSGPSSNGNGSG